MLLPAQLCALDFPQAAVKEDSAAAPFLLYFSYASHPQLFVCINVRLINDITAFVCALLFVVATCCCIYSCLHFLVKMRLCGDYMLRQISATHAKPPALVCSLPALGVAVPRTKQRIVFVFFFFVFFLVIFCVRLKCNVVKS